MSHRAFDGYTGPQVNNGIDGYSTTIRAQSSTGTTTNGGDLILGSGTGTIHDGYVRLFTGANEIARVVGNKFHQRSGQRIRMDFVGTTPFAVPDGYFLMLVDTSTLAITITMPANPVQGDLYQIKDYTGNAATGGHNITIQGNGYNIDGSASYLISSNFATVLLTYNGTNWNVL